MGTVVRLYAEASSDALARVAVDKAWAEIQQVDARLHPAAEGSDLAALHAAPVGQWVPASPLALSLMRRVRVLHAASHGVFDPCLPGWPGTLADLELSVRRWRMRQPLRLDLGGIAKGHAVDRAVMALRRAGCRAGIVEAGGDLRVFGPRTEHVRLGRNGRVVIEIARAALAVSEPSGAAPGEHQGYYCRVPGLAQRRSAAAVLAQTCAEADALAKCALFLPEAEAAALCAARGAQLLPWSWLQPGAAAAPADEGAEAQRSQLTQPESPST